MAETKDKFSLVPPKGISPEGWIKYQIKEDAENGWVAVCNKMSREGIITWDANSSISVPYYPPPDKWLMHFDPTTVLNRSVPFYQVLVDKTGMYGGGEYPGHWMDMLFRMSWVGGVKKLQNLAHQCVNEILKSCDETGYIGVDLPQVRFTFSYVAPFGMPNGGFEISGMGAVFNALLNYHRFTGNDKVLKAVIKAADLMLERTSAPKGMDNQQGGPLMVPPLVKLFQATGRQKYLDRARLILDYCLKEQVGGPYNSSAFGIKHHHCAAVGIYLLAALSFYRATGDLKLLARVRNINQQVVRFALQSHGAPTGHGEYLAESGPGVNTEGCDTAWWSWFWIEMVGITGETRYADLAEKCIFNALPGGRGKDGAASPYFMRPNQLFAVRGGHFGTLYGARLLNDCCLGNLGRVMPVLAEHMVLTTDDGGLAIPFYGPSTVKAVLPNAEKVEVAQRTDYPFSDEVKIVLKLEKGSTNFPVRLRIPGWCKSPKLKINGKETDIEVKESWVALERNWKPGDIIQLTLPMEIKVDVDKNGLATVQRGPLLYALPVKGRRVKVDRWGSFEQIVTAKDKWNYGLIINKENPSRSFTLKKMKVPKNSHVWGDSPIGLEVKAARLPDWKFPDKIKSVIPKHSLDIPEPIIPKQPFKKIGREEKILLIPYGFTILRMTHLPIIER